MTITEGHVQPATFAWLINPDGIWRPMTFEEITERCRPFIDAIWPVDGRPAFDQFWERVGPLRSATPIGAPARAQLFWHGETVCIYDEGYISINGRYFRRAVT